MKSQVDAELAGIRSVTPQNVAAAAAAAARAVALAEAKFAEAEEALREAEAAEAEAETARAYAEAVLATINPRKVRNKCDAIRNSLVPSALLGSDTKFDLLTHLTCSQIFR